ncbi:diguanylate cyclase [uncultured Vibrio sp.]|uniref:diguanylate cyclase n=1 Tax=uncultured Vibrio sp. TaxID=114054 RepID=UPI0009167849|nr:diguanylate cyclase [uncultured Vibrio sp.]OIQ26442.1 MAG: diguanylate cyclase [Vibrio sp. MedPE-SWchi]
MKPIVVLFLSLLSTFQTYAIEIALFVPRSETPAWQSQIKFAQAAADDLGITLHLYNAQNDSLKMLSQVRQATEQGVDGVLFMNYEQVGEQILAITEQKGIPSIVYNTGFISSELLPRTKYNSWIGAIIPDDEKAGSLLTEQLLLVATERKLEQINMLVINGNMKEVSAQQRNQGLDQFIKHHSKTKIVAESDSGPDWSRDEAKQIFKSSFQRYPEINMVWAASDTLALGARDAMVELSLPLDSIIIGGIDWLPEALEVIKSGEPYISIGGHFTEAAWGLILLDDYINGNDFAAESTQFLSRMYAINTQNIEMFQSFMGDTWQRIDFRAISNERKGGELYSFSIKYLLDNHYQAHNALILTKEEKQWLRENNTIKLAIDTNWPPFEYVNDQAIYQGIAADYMAVIGERLGIELEPSVDMNWSDVVDAAKRRELDMYPALAITESRKSYLNFTRPYLNFPMMIITNQDIPYVSDINSLNGRAVSVVAGYASQELLFKNHPDIQLFTANNVTEALEAVSTGRVAAYVGNIATANYIIAKEGFTNLKVSGVTPYRFELSMAIRSDWPILHSVIQKALDSLSEQEKKSIYSRWVSLRYEEGVDYKILWKTIFVSILVLAILGYWTHKLSTLNHKLNSEVAERKIVEHQLREEKTKIEKLAITDSLTGLYNRRHYNQIFHSEISRAQRSRVWLSFVILDIDYFKQYNDNYGHHNGDHQLVALAKTLSAQCNRASDYCFRLGGEEFGIVFSGQSPEEAAVFVEKLRASIERLQIKHEHSEAASTITASFGLVTSKDTKVDMEELYEAADAALYRAKRAGRNRIETVTLV